MMRKPTGTVTSLLTLLAVILATPAPALAQGPVDAGTAALRALESSAGAPVSLTRSAVTGHATFLRVTPGRPVPVPIAPSAPAEARAREFARHHGPAFGIMDPSQLRLFRAHPPDEVGQERVRFRQIHQGVPVTGGEVSVHLRGSAVVAVHAKTVEVPKDLGVTPSIDATTVLGIAQTILEKHLGVTDATLSEPRLEVFNRGHLESRRSPTHLAWFVEATRLDLREFIWIDAHTGALLLQFSQMPHARNRSVYDAGNTSALPGTFVRGEGSPDTGDADVDLAYRYAGDVYDYFLNEHGRDSFDGQGGEIRSTVRYCDPQFRCPLVNAFWNGSQMVYGQGFAQADDVVAHEITHAVTQYSANLFYYMQSGALNESFSDIFGETVDLTNSGGTDTSQVRWLMFEDVPESDGFRNMMNPNQFNDPGKMSDPQFVCEVDPPRGDKGGVHSNSGVPNHAYALMVDGGAYNGFTVTGIGFGKAAKIQYRALTHYLLSASDFLDNYNALKQACLDLEDMADVTYGDCAEVDKALDAVEMANPWPCQPAQASVPAVCPAGQTPTNVFFDNFENGGAGWVPQASVGTNVWFLAYKFATSGVGHLWGQDVSWKVDSALAMATGVPLPVGARMQFSHSFGFENSATSNFDGGVIEYSSDNGATWTDAGSLIASGAAYNGIISNASSNPLANRNAFVRDSFGYTASQLSLSILAGKSVRFRFRIGTDTTVNDYGWFIDDVRIYTCAAAPAVSVTPSWQDFGAVAIGQTADRTFTVSNSGGGTLTGSASTSAPFSIASGGSYNLAAGASQTVTVRFSPTAAGTFAGSVSFSVTNGAGVTRAVTGSTGAVVQPTSLLGVTIRGSAAGTVTSSPGGINCTSGTCWASFNTGATVTLTAAPGSGAAFGGWSGPYTGMALTCIVTVYEGVSVNASFAATFTDPTVTAGSTIRAAHVTELRAAIDTLRSRYSLAAFSWTDPSFAAGTTIRRAHFSELRTALLAVYVTAGIASPSFTDPALTAGVTPVRSAHLNELRNAVRALE